MPGDPCSSWDDACVGLQEGIDDAWDAVDDDDSLDSCEVWVAGGTYHIYETGAEDTVQLRSGVEVYGGFSGGETIRDDEERDSETTLIGHGTGDDEDEYVFHVVTGSNDSVLDGFTITQGGVDVPAVELNDYCGGGMLNIGVSPHVSNCRFANNGPGGGEGASGPGGAMCNLAESSPTITNCVFENNGRFEGGAIYNEDSSVTIINSTFENNQAYESGGAIKHKGGTLTVIGSHFVLNSTTSVINGEYGGAIFCEGTLNISDSTFLNNTVLGSSVHGGAVAAKGTLVLADSEFVNNQADGAIDSFGGALYYYGFVPLGSIDVTDTLFVGNTAEMGSSTAQGGGAYLDSGISGSLEDCVFADNLAEDGSGGALFVAGSYSINDCLFSGNEALDGGAIEVFSDSLELSDVFFTGNVADRRGGAIENYGAVEVENAVFTGNDANSGGAIYAVGEATLTNATFSGNNAVVSGSGIYVEPPETTVVNSILWDHATNELAGAEFISFSHSDVWGEGTAGTNIDENPTFMDVTSSSGTWGTVSYDSDTFMTELTVSGDVWTEEDLIGFFVQADTDNNHRYFIVDNSTNSVFIYGNYFNVIQSGDPFEIFDLHLSDGSPCIDRGNDEEAPLRDIEGNLRFDYSDEGGEMESDMGAYERQPPSL